MRRPGAQANGAAKGNVLGVNEVAGLGLAARNAMLASSVLVRVAQAARDDALPWLLQLSLNMRTQ
jgi:hypothetical protein